MCDVVAKGRSAATPQWRRYRPISTVIHWLPVAAQGDRLAYRAVKFVPAAVAACDGGLVMFASLAGAVQVSQRALRRAEQQRMMAEDAAARLSWRGRKRAPGAWSREAAGESGRRRARAERNMEAQPLAGD